MSDLKDTTSRTEELIRELNKKLNQAYRNRDIERINSLTFRLELYEKILSSIKEKQKSLNKTKNAIV